MIEITIIFILLYLIEAFHDNYVIRDSGKSAYYNRLWHKTDAMFHFTMWVAFAWMLKDWKIIPLGACVRLSVFQNTLNILRDKGFFYLGDGGIDGFLKRMFGSWGGPLLFSAAVSAIVVLNLMYAGSAG